MFADLKKAPIFAKIHVGLHLSKAPESKLSSLCVRFAPTLQKSKLGFTSAKLLKASFRRFAFGLHQHCKNRSWASPQQSS